MTRIVLHNYFRSSTSTRLRAALNLKALAFEYVAHHLRKGEHRGASYLAINPQGLVPSLVLEDGTVLTQSLAIIEYLEEVHPTPPLLPASAVERARVRALAHAIALDIHPVNNLRILNYLKSAFSASDEAVTEWFGHWVAETFKPLEDMLAADPRTGRFCHGDTPGLADICLYAQVLNNRRFGVDMSPYPTIARIFEACAAVPALAAAAPDRQPDSE
ncbi:MULTISPECIES: maleylacetoacetate isomerase [Chelativorans]|jgi:maleylpyruvate isomerase|uniref:Maleylacetoacetate isomerase n=1 Tax=Chelativorans sp. (strain BNC1) TaxID=266779 RepID=Q11CE3_CHESB|nr:MULTISPECIES: maleylacetoacetate isomerase [Chelativorans]